MTGLRNVEEATGLLGAIAHAAEERGLPFLLIGGLAVVEHGYGRTTDDMDLMIRRADQAAWIELLAALNYHPWQDGDSFMQFELTTGKGMPLDIMLTNDETFSQLHAGAMRRTVLGVSVPLPSLSHLLALKFHAIRHTRGSRGIKDMGDVASLIEVNRVDVTTPEFRELCDKYGTVELYDYCQRHYGRKN